jgi:hypothetical protein
MKRKHRIIVLAGLAWLLLSWMEHARAEPEVEPVIGLEHASHLLRGAPFNEKEEFQSEYAGGGVTINAGKHRAWEIDITHGIQRIERTTTDQATRLHVRFYPRRRRK